MTVFYKASELSSKAKTQEGHFQSAFQYAVIVKELANFKHFKIS